LEFLGRIEEKVSHFLRDKFEKIHLGNSEERNKRKKQKNNDRYNQTKLFRSAF
jgi:hypothetical protein